MSSAFALRTRLATRARESNPRRVDELTAVVRHPLGRSLPRQDGVARGRGHHRDVHGGRGVWDDGDMR